MPKQIPSPPSGFDELSVDERIDFVEFVLLVQRILFAARFWHRGVAIYFLLAQVADVGHGCGVGMESNARLLEHPELMSAASGVRKTDDRT